MEEAEEYYIRFLSGLFHRLLRNYEVDILEEFCAISWKLWWARNQLLWHNKVLMPHTIMSQALAISRDWKVAQAYNRRMTDVGKDDGI